MTYLFFSDTYVPRPDGVAHSVAWSSKALRELGKDVVVVRPGYGSRLALPHEVLMPSIRAFRRDYQVSWSSYFRSPTRWFQSSGIEPAHIAAIHVHTLGPIGMLGLRCAWAGSIPTVLSWHTDLFSYAKTYREIYCGAVAVLAQSSMCSPIRIKLSSDWSMPGTVRRLLRSVDRVVAPSWKTATQLSLLCPEAAVSIVPTGLPEYMFHAQQVTTGRIRDALGVSRDDKLLISVGRLSAEKNPELLISTIRAIRTVRPRVRCVAIGDPGPGRVGRKWQEALHDEDVIVLASMRHTELIEFYHAADLLFVSSLTETQGLTVLEAHAVGLPVVCVDPALAFFGDRPIPGVWIAESATPTHASETIVRVLDLPPAARSSGARASVNRSVLSSEAQAISLMRLYDELSQYGC